MPANRGRSLRYAAIAQLGERLICNQQVGSSILSGGCPTPSNPRPGRDRQAGQYGPEPHASAVTKRVVCQR